MIFLNKKFTNSVKMWLLFKKFSVKQSTYYRYKYIAEKYIVPYFKNKRINYFIDYDFNIYIDYLLKNLSPKTVGDILIVLKGILKFIGKKYNINYKLDLISIPKNHIDEIKILDNSEKDKLEDYCLKNPECKILGIAVCLLTGLRIGEICGLKWKNIDLKNKLIYVKKTIQRIYIGKNDTKILIDEPKTKSAMRAIPISNKLFDVLNKLTKENNFDEDDYFLTGTKKFIEPRNYERTFKKCLDACEIKNYNFHVLRHTFATNCINIGMDAKDLSVILGHSDVKITLNRYVHSSLSSQKIILDKL